MRRCELADDPPLGGGTDAVAGGEVTRYIVPYPDHAVLY